MSTRDEAFATALDYLKCNSIDGAIVELGVHRGASLVALLDASGGDRKLIGVDSFQGLPAPSEYDSAQFAAGQFRVSIEEVRAVLRAGRYGVPPVTLIEGWFAELDPIAEPIALVHLDCDLYESARNGLALVEEGIVDGAIVCIDDYYCHRARPDMGVRRAWSEWLKRTGRSATWFWRYAWHGAAFVVHGEGTS